MVALRWLPLVALSALAVAAGIGCGGGSPLDASDARTCEKDLSASDDLHIVEFAAVPDLSKAYGMTDWQERGQYVVDALRATAEQSQADAIAMVTDAGICIHRTTVNWISNSLVFAGPQSLADKVAKLPGVQAVLSEDSPAFDDARYTRVPAPTAPAWDLKAVRAPAAWGTGITGKGITIGVIDTGVDWKHPALMQRYRGYRGTGTAPVHDGNWWSPLDRFADAPVFTSPHGTHVTGAAVGGTGLPGGAPIGVAPGARFIAAVACTANACPLAGVLSGLQFMIAPTDRQGNGADPARRPQIVSNSWQRNAREVPLERAVTALEAAGVLPVFAVGNNGPACGSAKTPGTSDDRLLSVGASDRAGGVASVSGRGPAPGGGADPDVVAPGAGLISSIPARGYAASDGTSMAAPVVAGTAALVMQANPALVGRPEEVVAIIRRTASPAGDGTCGTTAGGRRNNSAGYGVVNADAAVRAAERRPPRRIS